MEKKSSTGIYYVKEAYSLLTVDMCFVDAFFYR